MFIWRHKLLLLIVLGILWYWFGNPSDRFGFSRQGLVIYDKFPIAFLDLYIDFDGNKKIVENLADPQSFNYWWSQNSSMYRTPTGDYGRNLVVGTGFGPTPSFGIPAAVYDSMVYMSDVKVTQVPSKDAVRLYNTLRDQGKTVAILLKLKN